MAGHGSSWNQIIWLQRAPTSQLGLSSSWAFLRQEAGVVQALPVHKLKVRKEILRYLEQLPTKNKQTNRLNIA